MSLKDDILSDLRAGQATADALAERFSTSHSAVHSELLKAREAGTVYPRKICDGALTVWSLSSPSDFPPIKLVFPR